MRPSLITATGHRTSLLVAVFVGLGIIGLAWPDAERRAPTMRTAAIVLAVGVAAFAIGRVVGGGRAPAPQSAEFIALNSLAAVAEELFFRRLVYGLLLPSGAGYAIGGSALLFAVVHVTTYGYWVLPIDLAAGVLLGWQRSSSQTWVVPALTHVAANVLVVV
jgi:membrane protease YdiL (CAAX protease family)